MGGIDEMGRCGGAGVGEWVRGGLGKKRMGEGGCGRMVWGGGGVVLRWWLTVEEDRTRFAKKQIKLWINRKSYLCEASWGVGGWDR